VSWRVAWDVSAATSVSMLSSFGLCALESIAPQNAQEVFDSR